MSISLFRKPEATSSHTEASVTLALPIEKPGLVECDNPVSQIAASLHMMASAHEASEKLMTEIRTLKDTLDAMERSVRVVWDRTRHAKMYLGGKNLS